MSIDALDQWSDTTASIIHLTLINVRAVESIASVSCNSDVRYAKFRLFLSFNTHIYTYIHIQILMI